MHVISLTHEPRPTHTNYNVGPQIFCSIAEYSYAYPKLMYWPETHNTLSIGRFCSIAADCEFLLGGEHDMSGITTYPFTHVGHFTDSARAAGLQTPVHIPGSGNSQVGNDVWIGRRAMILAGVSIGDGAVIGAGAIITKDVPPYAIMVGNPSRAIRYRFEDHEIDILLKVQWWDWPIDKIHRNIALIMGRDVRALLAAQ